MNCSVCSAAMKQFRNPDRWICPREGDHGKIEAAKRQGGGTGARNKGQSRPKSAGNLPKGKGGKK